MAQFQPFDPKILYLPEEAAPLLGYAVQTLAKWRSEGRGPRYMKMSGGRVHYLGHDLNEWQAGAQTGGTPAPEPTDPQPAEAA